MLLNALLGVVPKGYTPTSQRHQGQFAERVVTVDIWEYQAQVVLSRSDGTGAGQLIAEVHTPGNLITGTPCQITEQFWRMEGNCEVITVGTARVGVVTEPTGADRRLDQWAGYRYPDGTVIYLAQARRADDNSVPLPALPFEVPQLAALATDKRFDLR